MKKIIGRTEKVCSDCGILKPLDEFYKDDCYCKSCRINRSLAYQEGKHPLIHRRSANINRTSFSGFMSYMSQNKFYFQSVFGMKATTDNIKFAYFTTKRSTITEIREGVCQEADVRVY